MTDLTPIFEAVIALASAVITAFLIPYIKRKLGIAKFDELCVWVKVAVNAAEKIFSETGMGEKKKEYVRSFLAQKGYKLDVSELEAMIESQLYLSEGKKNE